MAYIGSKPADKALTSDDIADSIITSAKIADGTIASADLASGVGGKILQVVQTYKTTSFTTTSLTFTDITGLSASITPSSTSNKILVSVNLVLSNDTSGNYTGVRLLRGTTEIGSGTGATGTYDGANAFFGHLATEAYALNGFAQNYIDTPSTTSSTTYKLQMIANAGTATLGRRGNSDSVALPSSITLTEIAG